MPIILTTELGIARRGRRGRDWTREYTRAWRLTTDSASVPAAYVLANGPVSLGNSYNADSVDDLGAFVQEIEVACEGEGANGITWIFTASYGPYDPEAVPQNPTERPLQVSWGNATFEEIVDEDQDGNAVVNSAGDPFDPPITEEDTRPVLTVVRCQYTFSTTWATGYRNAINSDIFLGADPGTVRSMPIVGVLKKDQDIGWYWEVTYEFAYKPQGWARVELDQGLRRTVDVGGTLKRQPILVRGVPVQSPVLLDGAGDVLPPGGTPVFRTYRTRPSLPFAVFGFTEADFPGIEW